MIPVLRADNRRGYFSKTSVQTRAGELTIQGVLTSTLKRFKLDTLSEAVVKVNHWLHKRTFPLFPNDLLITSCIARRSSQYYDMHEFLWKLDWVLWVYPRFDRLSLRYCSWYLSRFRQLCFFLPPFQFVTRLPKKASRPHSATLKMQ